MHEGTRKVIAELEAALKEFDGRQEWHPEYECGITARLDPVMEYSGIILSEVNPDTEDATTVTIGDVEDESDAELICQVINHLPNIIRYVRYLEAKILHMEDVR